ncbi:MAG TPA: hypothetical protein DET40_01035 [Lentisphaeria bacterium]|nr:MAG: hypothetical protein A2X45_25110 [Lentisphaerae bacterium GWF2_50_93]HCE42116.1 hypothetical protein [Lentisphaeria bacterium]
MFRRMMMAVAFAMICSLNSNAEDLILFGTDKGRLAGADETKGALSKITFDKDFLKMDGPNFWSSKWQHNSLAVDLTDAKPGDPLKIEVAGALADQEPFLKIMFFSPDWSKNSSWIFDLSKIKKDEFTVVTAKTSLGDPAEKNGGGVVLTSIGNVMFFAGAKAGNSPWSIKIKSVSVGTADAKK